MAGESSDRGATWSDPERVSIPSDRGNYSAVAASPEGDDLYLVYNAFTTPFRNNTTQARGLVGVVTVAPHLLEHSVPAYVRRCQPCRRRPNAMPP